MKPIRSVLLLNTGGALATNLANLPQIRNLAMAQISHFAARAPQTDTVSSTDSLATTALSTLTTSTTTNARESTTSTSTSATSTSTTKNHNIAVGQNSTQFTPSTLKNIPIGDTLTFYFYPTNYSIIESTFAQPCQPDSSPGIFSGWNPSGSTSEIARQKFVVNITTLEPMWLYALDGTALAADLTSSTACELGMAMVVNPILPKESAGGQTLTNYKKSAAKLASASASASAVRAVPSEIWGGEVKSVSDKEKTRWESKHPLGGNLEEDDGTNGTTSAGVSVSVSASGGNVQDYQSGGVSARRVGTGYCLTVFGVAAGIAAFAVGL